MARYVQDCAIQTGRRPSRYRSLRTSVSENFDFFGQQRMPGVINEEHVQESTPSPTTLPTLEDILQDPRLALITAKGPQVDLPGRIAPHQGRPPARHDLELVRIRQQMAPRPDLAEVSVAAV